MTYILTMVLLISGARVHMEATYNDLSDCLVGQTMIYDNQDDDYIVLSSKCVKA